MALRITRTYNKSGGLSAAIAKQLRLMNLKASKSINIKFDPFEPSANTVRVLSFHLGGVKVTDKNPRCKITTQILSDRSESAVEVTTINKEKFIFKCGNLSVLEVLQLYNKYITPLAPEDPVQDTQLLKDTGKEKKKKK